MRNLWTPVAVVLATTAMAGCQGEPEESTAAATPQPVDEVQVVLRQLAAKAPPEFAEGKDLFEQNCSQCHGPAADGSASGPPLVHKIYEPSHHADAAFILAARNGVRAHHWRFGDMPPVEGVTDAVVLEIVAYVRWLQRQVGIE